MAVGSATLLALAGTALAVDSVKKQKREAERAAKKQEIQVNKQMGEVRERRKKDEFREQMSMLRAKQKTNEMAASGRTGTILGGATPMSPGAQSTPSKTLLGV